MAAQFSAGDFSANPLEKEGYRLEFQDEFDGAELDTNKWIPFYLAHWSSRKNSAAKYSFKDGNLILEITENQGPWCPEFDGNIKSSVLQTGTFSGSVDSNIGQLRFSEACRVREEQPNQTTYLMHYGYIETRLKALKTDTDHVALWMIGYEDTPEKSAELCICEIMGAHVTSTSSRIGYGTHPFSDPSIKDEFYEDFLPIDASNYHIYALEWTPKEVHFYVDNIKVRTIQQSPNYPMQLMLSLYERPSTGKNIRTDGLPVTYPKQFVVDYVRVYKPLT
ncbi:MAG: glycoside hydrolase family 16 protein [Trueperaceae bacterium]